MEAPCLPIFLLMLADIPQCYPIINVLVMDVFVAISAFLQSFLKFFVSF